MTQNDARHRWDQMIDAISAALGLAIDEAWKPSVRANLEVTMRMAQLVEEFPLPDDIEPAEIYEA